MFQAEATAGAEFLRGVGVGQGVAACISLDQQEDQCDMSMTSEGRMVEEIGLETGARL